MTENLLNELKNRLYEAADLGHAASVLNWDMSTYMPPKGAPQRGRAMATLNKLQHEKFTDPAVGNLLDQLETALGGRPAEDDAASLVRVTRREYDRAVKVPASLVGEISEVTSALYDAWTRARPANDFASLMPMLEKELDLFRQMANCFPGYQHISDPLINFSDYGMSAESIRSLFAELRAGLVPIVKAIAAAGGVDDSPLHQLYPEQEQESFGVEIIKDYGYDFERGRQDRTHHPFMTRFSGNDIRITTRFNENYLGDGLFSTLHEAGHALYEQGITPSFDGTPLGGGTSTGVHESQSRLWENIVGRSHGFWSRYYSQLQAIFPEQLNPVSLDEFYRAVNTSKPSLIRVDADEVTYNLHVMIRFDLELKLLEGSLAVKDLPEAWQSRYASDLGLTAPDDRDGVLQDVHWYAGIFGYFQGYALGNLMSAQFYDAALRANPSIPDEIAQGEFAGLRTWLTENIYQHGSKFTADELLHRVTGEGLGIKAWIKYIQGKYGGIYKL
ncbi:MAG: carboxypeptidase M32 [Anaerolineae bacterium]|nr:carboxypeptidase M32 [Anaerolineae bacterium]